jgi:hypothetical protein
MRSIVLVCKILPATDREDLPGMLRAFDMSWTFLERTDPAKTIQSAVVADANGEWLRYRVNTDVEAAMGITHIACFKRNVKPSKVGPVFFHAHELYGEFVICAIVDGSLEYFNSIREAKGVVTWLREKQEHWHEQYHSHRAYCTEEEKTRIKEAGAEWHEVH